LSVAINQPNGRGKEQPAGKPTQGAGGKPQVKKWQLAVAVIVMLVYMVWLGQENFKPKVYHNALMDKFNNRMKKYAMEAGPNQDLSKMNPVDRAAFLKEVAGAPYPPRAILAQIWKYQLGH
jgi:hypothetical protein